MGRHALPAGPVPEDSVVVARPTEVAPQYRTRAEARAAERAALHVVRRPAVERVRRASRPVVVARTAAVTRAADVRPAPHVRRTMKAQRLALLVAPVIAMTSALSCAMPANAATVEPVSTSTSVASQSYSVSRTIEVPEIDNGVVTVVSYPSVVVSGGASVADAQSTIGAALSAGGERATVLQTALAYLGTPYAEGGASHQSIDCSGLTMVAYAAVGIPLAHYVPTQDAAATTIPESEALPGDLVVYDNQDHVGIFLGNGLVLQAPHPGATVDIVPMYPAAHHFARLLPAS
ncbi:C40 family peptidase [Curtobacterium sp. RRHDQ10]|uniref:C40 family peptidase n=1 Tax=Curtobacterium phyllosphaerae TaxID=3413379 RepID=UPI003BEFFE61